MEKNSISEKIEKVKRELIRADLVREFARIRKINEEEAREIATKEIEIWIKDYLCERDLILMDIEEIIDEILTNTYEGYLSIDFQEMDKEEVKGTILTTFGGPTTWIPIVIDEYGVSIDKSELDYEYEWYHRKLRVRDKINYLDIITIDYFSEDIKYKILERARESIEQFE